MNERLLLRGARVHTGDAVLSDVAVLVDGARISAVGPTRAASSLGARVVDLGGAVLAPGFVDLQVNGGGGVMLNDAPSVSSVEALTRAHRRFGTTGLLPTYITGPTDGMRDAAHAVHEARRRGGRASGVLGIHFEGPFLDERRPGAHEVRYLRAPGAPELAVITGAAVEGAVVLLTLATRHYDDATARALQRAGVFVSLGHSGATAAEAQAAFARGATLVTHLFNAMSPLSSREGGLVGAALDAAASGRAQAGLILDGVHVAFDVARVAARAAGPGGLFLVTDAVSPVGAPTGADTFLLGGQRVRVTDGRCVNEAGVLAGSALDMATAVRNAAAFLDGGLEEALRRASLYPAVAVGLGGRKGRIAPGYDADLVWFDGDVDIRGTLVGGVFGEAGAQ